MSDTAPATETVFRLMYRSRDLIPPEQRKVEHGTLFTIARSNNKSRHITGALLVAGDWFVQTLEGDEDAVRALFTRIEADPRHDSVALIETRTVSARVFPRWSMASVAASGSAPDTYLIAHADGIAPAASRGTTAQQEYVLSVMRDSARGAAHAS